MSEKQLVFTTHNPNKLQEIQQMMPEPFQLMSLADIGFTESIDEDQETIQGNARKKARVVYEKTGHSCFSDDTGLEVDALNGEPGVYSARFAGANATNEANRNLLLEKLSDEDNRQARFITIIALILNGTEYLFEGIKAGKITENPQGEGNFGYDPIFLPHGYDETFAEMDPVLKNRISHRGKAFSKMINFLADHVG